MGKAKDKSWIKLISRIIGICLYTTFCMKQFLDGRFIIYILYKVNLARISAYSLLFRIDISENFYCKWFN